MKYHATAPRTYMSLVAALSRTASKTYERSSEMRLVHYKTYILRAQHSTLINAPVREHRAY